MSGPEERVRDDAAAIATAVAIPMASAVPLVSVNAAGPPELVAHRREQQRAKLVAQQRRRAQAAAVHATRDAAATARDVLARTTSVIEAITPKAGAAARSRCQEQKCVLLSAVAPVAAVKAASDATLPRAVVVPSRAPPPSAPAPAPPPPPAPAPPPV